MMSAGGCCVILLLCFLATSQSQSTCDGNANGANCVFPFLYQGVTFNQCTYYGEEKAWCPTTSDYSVAQEWGFCECDAVDTPSPTTSNLNDAHYAYTKASLNHGVIQTLVVRLLFNDRLSEHGYIEYDNVTYQTVVDSVAAYFSDSSWHQLTYNFTLIDETYISALPSATTSLGQIALEAYKFAEQDGYVWCDGICGRHDEKQNNLARTNHKRFDQLVVIVHDQSDVGNADFGSWSGLASSGHPKTWVLPTAFNPATLEHELGHNLGLAHQYTTKYGRSSLPIGETYDGESRMAAGGTVDLNDPTSRYRENGHFGPCAKDWFGWLDEDKSHIIDLTLNQSNNETRYNYRLHPFDRPDIALTDNRTFVLRLSWPSQYEYYEDVFFNRVYLYYRTSYDGPNAGLSVQYCLLKKVLDAESGAYIQTYTYDVNGDSYSQDDHYVDVGQSFVVDPFLLSLEDNKWSYFVNPYLAALNKINVTVIGKGDGWNSCNAETFVCDDAVTDLLFLDIAVNFVAQQDDDDDDHVDSILECNATDIQRTTLAMNATEKYKVVHVRHDVVGVYGRGQAQLRICPHNTHIRAFIFDRYPNNIPKSIGSVMAFTFIGEMDASTLQQQQRIYPVRAIQLRQNEALSLHIAEIEVYQDMNGSNIIAGNSNVKCYSFPHVGHEVNLVDGNKTTFSHSENAEIGAYDVCVFDEPIVNISHIAIYPRDSWWSRSENLTLNLYGNAFPASTSQESGMVFTDLLFTHNIVNSGTWEDKHELVAIPALTHIIDTSFNQNNYQCNSSSQFVTVPFIHGQFYMVLERGDFENSVATSSDIYIDVSLNGCSIEQCPINTYSSSSSVGMDGNTSLICKPCPANHRAEVGATSVDQCTACPYHRELKSNDSSWCSIAECAQIILTHDNGLFNPLDGVYDYLGRRKQFRIFISSSFRYAVQYNIQTQNYQIIDVANQSDIVAYSAATDKVYPFLLRSRDWYERGVTHIDNIANTRIKAIKIIQRNNDTNVQYNVLELAEIEMFTLADPTVNIAPLSATCYSFPITPQSVFSYYQGDENGTVSVLTDQDLMTTTSNGNANDYQYCSREPCYDVCVLDDALELDRVVIYPRQSSWRFYRSAHVRIQMFSHYELHGDDVDAENEAFMVYDDEDASITVNTTINIPKVVDDDDKPIQIVCPFKYALSCDAELDALCDDDWLARYTQYDNDEPQWLCMNPAVLTDDLLNYRMDKITDYSERANRRQSMDQQQVTDILQQSADDYIVRSVHSECYIDGEFVLDILALNGNENIACRLRMYNSNGDEIVSHSRLLWSIELLLASNGYYFYPIKGKNYLQDTDGFMWTNLSVPNCEFQSGRFWTLSLSFDQTAVGGDKIVVWSTDVEILTDVAAGETSQECIRLISDDIASLVDTLEYGRNDVWDAIVESSSNYVAPTTDSPTSAAPTTASPTTAPTADIIDGESAISHPSITVLLLVLLVTFFPTHLLI